MRPLRLTVENFASFRGPQPVLDISDFDLFAIAGPTGAGKSSLLDAIVFGLYGRIPRLGKGVTEMISLGRDRMAVTLDFRCGDSSYRVTRVARRGRSADAQIEDVSNGKPRSLADGVLAVNQRVQRLLGLGYDAFTQAVILPQGEFARFLKSQPGDRREILRDLLRLQVYEKMRKRAAEQATALCVQVQGQQALLEREYADATPETLATLERRLGDLASAGRGLAAEVTTRDTAIAELRLRHRRTRELRGKRQQAEALAARKAAVAGLEARLGAARRAAGILPRLEAAAEASRRSRSEDERLSGIEEEARRAAAVQEAAHTALEAAESRTSELPALEERLRALDEVQGLLGPRDAARRRAEQARGDLERRRRELDQARRDEAAAATRLRDLEATLAGASRELEDIGYDAERHQRLDGLRDSAAELAARRQAAADASHSLAEAKREADAAAKEDARAERAARDSARRRTQSQDRLDQAESALAEAERDHAALHLRATLRKGEACPVCEHAVSRLPRSRSAPLLDEVRERRDLARREEQAAQEASAAARADAAQASHAAERTRTVHTQVAAAAATAKASLADAEGALRRALAFREREPLPELRLRGLIEELSELRRRHEAALARRDGRHREVERIRHDAQTRADRAMTLAESVEELKHRLEAAEVDRTGLESRIAAVTTDPNPAAERERLAGTRVAIESARQQARQREREAVLALRQAQTLRREALRAAEQARAAADETRRSAADALREAGFAEDTAVRAAALPHAEQERLTAEIEGHYRETHAVLQRMAELKAELAGAEVDDALLEAAETALDGARRRLDAARREEAALAERLRELGKRAASASLLTRELSQHKRQLVVSRQLADDLRSERFQSYLLEEAFGELVRGASERLMALSGRYALEFRNDAFHVLDHDNARERRSAETLSGGETFLASLALALELSQQIQNAAGAARLDSLFVDEGFGTLDPETLETITDAIMSLPAGGRMVGIITHIPELTERLPVRLQVEKRPEASRVVVHAN